MNRRVVTRVALAALALYGCAQVLGIDDLPVPDAPDGGGSADGSLREASSIDDGRSPFDVIAPLPADANADADSTLDAGADGDASPPFVTIQLGTFDPSSVVWDPVGKTLYVADNAAQMGGTTTPSAAILAFPDAGDQWSVLEQLDLPAGERFGQISYSHGVGEWIVPVYGGTTFNRIYRITTDSNAQRQIDILPQTDSFYGSAIVDTEQPPKVPQVFLTTRRPNAQLTRLASGSTNPMIQLVIDGGSIAVASTAPDTITIATVDGKLRRYAFTNTTLTPPPAVVGTGVPDAGYMVPGPGGGYLVGAGAFIRLVVDGGTAGPLIGRPQVDGGFNDPFDNVGAFSYDVKNNRIFVPEGMHDEQRGRIVIFMLPLPQ